MSSLREKQGYINLETFLNDNCIHDTVYQNLAKYEMFKRRSEQGEEEGTFYVLHIIPLIFFPSFYN
jgi:hypothetical protein